MTEDLVEMSILGEGVCPFCRSELHVIREAAGTRLQRQPGETQGPVGAICQ